MDLGADRALLHGQVEWVKRQEGGARTRPLPYWLGTRAELSSKYDEMPHSDAPRVCARPSLRAAVGRGGPEREKAGRLAGQRAEQRPSGR